MSELTGKNLDAWLVQKINGDHEPCIPPCRPTTNVKQSLSLLETFMGQHKDRWTHIELAYDSTYDQGWIVYICSEKHSTREVFKSGYPLAVAICEALKEAIESLEE